MDKVLAALTIVGRFSTPALWASVATIVHLWGAPPEIAAKVQAVAAVAPDLTNAVSAFIAAGIALFATVRATLKTVQENKAPVEERQIFVDK